MRKAQHNKKSVRSSVEHILNVKRVSTPKVRRKIATKLASDSPFLNAMHLMQTRIPDTFTTNGALAYSSTMDPVLDFYQRSGAMRGVSEREIVELFKKAYRSNKELALRALFYTRDIRGGQGERRTFRVILKWLGKNHPKDVIKNLVNVPFFGRWDDLFVLMGTPVENEVIALINNQLVQDLEISVKLGAK